MPTHAHLMVRDGEELHADDLLAKIPREITKTKDITGGLPNRQEGGYAAEALGRSIDARTRHARVVDSLR